MATESMEEMVYLAVKIVIAIIGIVLLVSIIKGVTQVSYEQITFANVEKLKSAMEEACLRGADEENPVTIENFQMPQTLPIFANTWGVNVIGETFIGKNAIHPAGDPTYVLYYEMFPPGEGMSWEVYYDGDEIGNRVIAMIDDTNDLPGFIRDVRELVKAEIDNDFPINVVIGNIELTEDFDVLRGMPINARSDFFRFGEWESTGNNDDFIFSNYLGLSSLNKTLVKHMPCGENRLCLKTTKGIYTYDFKYCNFSYIQLVDENRQNHLGHTDFYLASPCEMEEVKVYIVDDCSINSNIDEKCERSVTFNMYRYVNDELVSMGEHTTCLDRLEGKDNAPESSNMPCIRVEFSRAPDSGCYTYQEFQIFEGVRFVEQTTSYIDSENDNIFLIKPKEVQTNLVLEVLATDENPIWPPLRK